MTAAEARDRAAAPRHLLSLRDLSQADWDALLASAERLSGPAGRRPLLAGRRLGMLFFNASLRTRTAFEVACFDLGAHAVSLQVGGNVWKLEYRDGMRMDGEAAEHVREGIPVLGRMLDGLGVRCFAGLADAADDARDPLLNAIAAVSTVPVLNLESAMDHPHQGLADALALRRHLRGATPVAVAARSAASSGGPRDSAAAGDTGTIAATGATGPAPQRTVPRARVVLSWAPHIKPLPLAVPHAALMAFAHEGHDIALCHPPGFELDAGVLSAARAAAVATGGSLSIGHDRQAALDGAQVVYVKSWGARGHYGDAAAAAASFAAHRDWMLTGADLGPAAFMHCLPVRRGVVVADEVLDGGRSLVLEQAGARLDVQKATLCRALGVVA